MVLKLLSALITQPFSSMLATFVQIKSTRILMITLGGTLLLGSYIFVVSCMSPCPPLKNHWIGGYLMVNSFSFFIKTNGIFYFDYYLFFIKILAWILSYALLMYLRCCITSRVKTSYGEKPLVWCGLLSQLGQFLGSMLVYFLVEFTPLFKEADKCNPNQCS